jgi:hypothetical protein
MGEASLPRPAAKYLAGLGPESRETLTPLVARVHQALVEGADKGRILEIVAAHPVHGPAQELALLEALARLPHPLMPEIVQAHFSGGHDKARRKALKKAYHHLKAQGVKIPPDLVKSEERAVVRPLLSAAPVKGYLSRPEGNGSRMLILQLPRQGQSFNLFLALVNDLDGIQDAYAVLLSNKETKKYLEQTGHDMPGELVEAPPAHVLKIIEDAYHSSPDQAVEAVATYVRVRSVLKNRLGQETAPELQDLLPVLEDREPYLEQSRDLALEEDFFNWHFTPEDLTPWFEKIQEIENSPLVLTPEQKVARVERTIDEATRELFPSEKRRLLRRRLLEMAYYLDRTGRPHLARQAQAAGEDLERDRSPLERENPFLFGLLMFPLREMYEMAKAPREQQPQSQGRILTEF